MLLHQRTLTCPKCNTLHTFYLIASSNTINAVTYSDGKTIGPMYSIQQKYGRCTNCAYIFLIKNAEVPNTEPEKIMPIPGVSFITPPDLYDFASLLDSQDEEALQDEKYIRTQIFQLFNDRLRKGNPLFHERADKALWRSNLLKLSTLLDITNPYDAIMKAEVMRNLGHFGHARSILTSIKDKDLLFAKKQILKKCLLHQKRVFEFRNN